MNIAIIVAGGIGSRVGASVPKQFIEVDNTPIIIHTIKQFESHDDIDKIVIACHPLWKDYLEKQIECFEIKKILEIVDGKDTRQQSVYNALVSLENICDDNDIVLIHDAARPLVSRGIISSNIKIASEYKACVTAIACVDTMIFSSDNTLEKVVDRNKLFRCQTPQSFNYAVIKKAHEGDFVDATDDAQLVKLFGYDVHLVEGSSRNFKITTKEDLEEFEKWVKK